MAESGLSLKRQNVATPVNVRDVFRAADVGGIRAVVSGSWLLRPVRRISHAPVDVEAPGCFAQR